MPVFSFVGHIGFVEYHFLLVHVYTCSIYTTEYKSSEKAISSQI